MQKKIIWGLLTFLLSLVAQNALMAQTKVFNFKSTCNVCNTEPWASNFTQLTNTLSSLENTANNALSQNAQAILDSRKAFMKAMANGSVGSMKGIGTDYGSNIDLFIVGATAGIGANLGSTSISNVFSAFDGLDIQKNGLPDKGIGVNIAANIGISMHYFKFLPSIGPIDLKDVILFLNVLSLDIPEDTGAKGGFTNFGMHAQYKYIKPKSFGFGLLRWGGVDFSAGFDFSSVEARISSDIPFDTPIPDTSALNQGFGFELKATSSAKAEVGADVTVFSIPLEVSTNVRILYFLTLIGGLGVDINLGSGDLLAKAGGKGSITYSPDTSDGNYTTFCGGDPNNSLCKEQEIASLEVTADLSESAMPTFLDIRPFFGMQIGTGKIVKMLVMGQYSLIANTYSINFGAGIYW